MPRKVITPALYDALLAGFRLYPANYTRAGAYAGVELRFARRAWNTGWTNISPQFRPISQVLIDEKDAAEALVRKRMEEERAAREAEKQVARQEGIERKVEMLRLAKAVRGTLATGVASLQRAGAVLVKLMETLPGDLQAMSTLPPREKLRMAKDFVLAEARLVESFERIDRMTRLDEGKPTELIQVESMTLAEAVNEIEGAKGLLDLAREEGLLDLDLGPDAPSGEPLPLPPVKGSGSNGLH